ncbi:MGH1-like glycoside hydrolase domain-containing protein [Maribacter sp. ACAM166]|uniref:MGH1-like glycoside hydrolase domain-containing protein n=1 Tax=Maribacter sp. ACAM166 TaxID=2508996 RepID=UPI0010FD1E17|nr:discoidin domain-containing protein [Maribacter sp. ACAM166]TLP74025.1 hypothetical protein ES765_16950 [Maribacter sp. ACAM166]
MLGKKNNFVAVVFLALFAFTMTAQKVEKTKSLSLLDKQEMLDRQSWWDNMDWEWYKENIPFFDSPETLLNATYYYRWEVLTKHLIYGSPEAGYTFTEFMDRPGWSGTFGAISCPLGFQFSEVRWLKNRRVVHDFSNYWFNVPGAEPRSYSNWYGDSMWDVYKVWQDKEFIEMVYPHMKQQYEGWITDRYDSEHEMFKWDGMHDGMESNINGRQTENWFAGAEGYRPTLNSYLYGDLVALSKASELLGYKTEAEGYQQNAEHLKKRIKEELWDTKRNFFFHQWSVDKEAGLVKAGTFHEWQPSAKDSIKKYSLTYETGLYKGSLHGRELMGYVPWQFNIPDENHNIAWQYLMDENYFWSEYGPTTTEQGDPLFHITKNCCVWSGKSWPFATSQTLEAMANVLNNYEQDFINKQDYLKVLRTYSKTQQLNGRPYIAESANPFTGSWDGSNHYYHSEHYFHSQYINLIITGLVGLRPRSDDFIEINPLIPDNWNYFALDDVNYHGHKLSILWDEDGEKYNKGKGLMIFLNGDKIDSTEVIGHREIKIPSSPPDEDIVNEHNFAVNNSTDYFPRLTASFANPKYPEFYAQDGNYWYHKTPGNRWTNEGDTSEEVSLQLDFGIERTINKVSLYFLNDGSGVEPPMDYVVNYWENGQWKEIPNQKRNFNFPNGNRQNVIEFSSLTTTKIKVGMQSKPNAYVGITEIEAWGNEDLPLKKATSKSPNLAYNEDGAEYPKLSASYTSEYDQLAELNDMKCELVTRSNNRWTTYNSPNNEDWVVIDFGTKMNIDKLDLYLYDDGRGIKTPKSYEIEYWLNGKWVKTEIDSINPKTPTGMAVNTVLIKPVMTDKIRIVFEHSLPAFTGLSEVMIWDTKNRIN